MAITSKSTLRDVLKDPRAVAIIENRIGFQIVHAAEDTFLCYTQYSCKKAKGKVWIVLESS